MKPATSNRGSVKTTSAPNRGKAANSPTWSAASHCSMVVRRTDSKPNSTKNPPVTTAANPTRTIWPTNINRPMLRAAPRLRGSPVNSPVCRNGTPAKGESEAAAKARTSSQEEKRSKEATSPGICTIKNPHPPAATNPRTAQYRGGVKFAATCHISVLRKKKAANSRSNGKERIINSSTWRICSVINSNPHRTMETRP